MFPILVFIMILLIRDLAKYSKISDKTKEFLLRNNIKFEENGNNWNIISDSKEIIISQGI